MSYLIFTDQRSFMRHFRQEPSFETAALYVKLCEEEYAELQTAWKKHVDGPTDETVTEIADACVDLIYVVAGVMHSLGLDPQPLWDEVHRSNIDKIKHPCSACEGAGAVAVESDDDEAPRTAEPCRECRGQGHLYEVRRRDDGKVLKPQNWTPPALLPLVRMMRAKQGGVANG